MSAMIPGAGSSPPVGATPQPVTLAEVKDYLPQMVINTTSKPSEAQVSGMITNITAEVRARLQACGAVWPADPASDPAIFLKQTIMEGIIYSVLRARFMLTKGAMQPEEVSNARTAYNDRLKVICDVARGVQSAQTSEVAGVWWPTLGWAGDTPNLTGDFFDYTMQRDADANRASRTPFRRPF